jgi:hypothetical protein
VSRPFINFHSTTPQKYNIAPQKKETWKGGSKTQLPVRTIGPSPFIFLCPPPSSSSDVQQNRQPHTGWEQLSPFDLTLAFLNSICRAVAVGLLSSLVWTRITTFELGSLEVPQSQSISTSTSNLPLPGPNRIPR